MVHSSRRLRGLYRGSGIHDASPAPSRLRLGSSEASIGGFDFRSRSAIMLATPFAARIAGTKVRLIDALGLGPGGVLESGRLSQDAELSVGGQTLRVRGAYDPERPNAGIVGFYPQGELSSATLAKDARILTAKAELGLVWGDNLSFRTDGSLQSVTPEG